MRVSPRRGTPLCGVVNSCGTLSLWAGWSTGGGLSRWQAQAELLVGAGKREERRLKEMEARLSGYLAGAAGGGSAQCGFALGLVRHELLSLLADLGTEASFARAPEWVALFRATSEQNAPLLKLLQCAPAPPLICLFAALGPGVPR